MVRRAGAEEWTSVENMFATDLGRGTGVADLAYAIASGRAHRCSGDLAYHVLDAMFAVEEASDSGRHVLMESRCDRPAPLPPGLAPGQLDGD